MAEEKSEITSPVATPASPPAQHGGISARKGEHVAAWKQDEVHQIPDNNLWIGWLHLQSFPSPLADMILLSLSRFDVGRFSCSS